MMYFTDELQKLAALMSCSVQDLEAACLRCKKLGEYPVFHVITTLGVEWATIAYARPKGLPNKQQKAKHFNVSYLGVQPTKR